MWLLIQNKSEARFKSQIVQIFSAEKIGNPYVHISLTKPHNYFKRIHGYKPQSIN